MSEKVKQQSAQPKQKKTAHTFSREDVARNPQPVFMVTELSSAMETHLIPENELAQRKVDVSQSIAGVDSSAGVSSFSQSAFGAAKRNNSSEESEDFSIDARIPDLGAEAKRVLETSNDSQKMDMSSFDATDAKHRNVPN